MNSEQIQQHIESWVKDNNFNAPYGVLTNERTNPKGKKYLTVTFGRARTLDATVEIYNSKFMLLKASNRQTQVYKSLEELQEALNTL